MKELTVADLRKIESYTAVIQRLRAETGEGLLACRRALDVHLGNFDDALEHLRCAGQAVVRRPGSKKPCGCLV